MLLRWAGSAGQLANLYRQKSIRCSGGDGPAGGETHGAVLAEHRADAAREVFAHGGAREVEFAVLAIGVVDHEPHLIGAGRGLEHARDGAQERLIGEHVVGLEDGDDEAGGVAADRRLDAGPRGFGGRRRLWRRGAMGIAAGAIDVVAVRRSNSRFAGRRRAPSGWPRLAVAPTGAESPLGARRGFGVSATCHCSAAKPTTVPSAES